MKTGAEVLVLSDLMVVDPRRIGSWYVANTDSLSRKMFYYVILLTSPYIIGLTLGCLLDPLSLVHLIPIYSNTLPVSVFLGILVSIALQRIEQNEYLQNEV